MSDVGETLDSTIFLILCYKEGSTDLMLCKVFLVCDTFLGFKLKLGPQPTHLFGKAIKEFSTTSGKMGRHCRGDISI
jgi:hypothetical protein